MRYRKVSPGSIGSWVSPGTPSKRFSSRMPCQWTAVGRSSRLVTFTLIVASCGTWIRGPGYCPLKPYIVNVRPLMVRLTSPASRSSVPPSPSRTISRGRAAGSGPAADGRKGSTAGVRRPTPGILATDACIGGRVQPRAGGGGAPPTIPVSASRSSGSMRMPAEVPRSTMRPSHAGASGSDSAVTRTRNLSRSTGPTVVRPFATGPRFTTGRSRGVVAHAT